MTQKEIKKPNYSLENKKVFKCTYRLGVLTKKVVNFHGNKDKSCP